LKGIEKKQSPVSVKSFPGVLKNPKVLESSSGKEPPKNGQTKYQSALSVGKRKKIPGGKKKSQVFSLPGKVNIKGLE
jgi:hypothetical protein